MDRGLYFYLQTAPYHNEINLKK